MHNLEQNFHSCCLKELSNIELINQLFAIQTQINSWINSQQIIKKKKKDQNPEKPNIFTQLSISTESRTLFHGCVTLFPCGRSVGKRATTSKKEGLPRRNRRDFRESRRDRKANTTIALDPLRPQAEKRA